MKTSRLDELLRTRKILITCGTGGVGKTTLSASIALRAAMLGKRAVVITIDPAKRLATSLGIGALGDRATDLSDHLRKAMEAVRKQGMKEIPAELLGSLHAIVPDTRKTFEQLVADLGFDAEGAERVKSNPIFRIFAKEFSGTNEYMAMQRLYSLHLHGKYDCIILDTPPSRNTLDFLEAPKLLARFYDDKIFQWLIVPANKLVSGGMRKILGLLEKLTGGNFMSHLIDFASSLFEVQISFKANLGRVTEMLESKTTGFVLVASPSPENAPEIAHFIDSVEKHRFRFDGLILNRTLGYLKPGIPGVQRDPDLKRAFEVLDAIQVREARANEDLKDRIGMSAAFRLPELARDVHSVEDLVHVAMAFDRSFP